MINVGYLQSCEMIGARPEFNHRVLRLTQPFWCLELAPFNQAADAVGKRSRKPSRVNFASELDTASRENFASDSFD